MHQTELLPYLVNLERFRTLAGFSRPQLAQIAGTTPETVKALETTNQEPRLSLALELCRALHLAHPEMLTDQRFNGETIRAPIRHRRSSKG
jgi:DNA-binding XRE family transcriptional regulator